MPIPCGNRKGERVVSEKRSFALPQIDKDNLRKPPQGLQEWVEGLKQLENQGKAHSNELYCNWVEDEVCPEGG